MNNPEARRLYAIRPVNNELVTKTISIGGYKSGVGLTDLYEHTYTAVDMEQWAIAFLQAVDQFLAVLFSASDNRAVNADVKAVLRAKELLIEAIPAGVAALFPSVDVNSDALAVARTALSAALVQSLSDGYRVAAILVDADEEATLFAPGAENAPPVDGIPAPLRSFPQTPILRSQQSRTVYPEATTVMQGRQVEYVFQFNSHFSRQDSLYLNLPQPEAVINTPAQIDDDLFAPLAQFLEVWPQLQKRFPKRYDPRLLLAKATKIAISTFVTLACPVAEAWAGYWEHHANKKAVGPAQSYILTKQFRSGEPDLLESLQLVLPESAPVPSIAVHDADGQLCQLAASKINETLRIYSIGAGISSPGKDFKVTFPADILNLGEWYPALCILRNNFEHLNPEFVYLTSTVQFPTVDVPYIVQTSAIQLDDALPRGVALKECFEQLFGGATGVPVSLRISFLVQNDQALPMPIPVVLIPKVIYDDRVVNEVSVQLADWLDRQAAGIKGLFSMEVTVFNGVGNAVFVLQDVRFK